MSTRITLAKAICQHHDKAYDDVSFSDNMAQYWVFDSAIPMNGVIEQTSITITETCCVVVSSAMLSPIALVDTQFEIEQPLGTIKTINRSSVTTGDVKLMHHSGYEVLPAGTYTYYLMNRFGASRTIQAAWINVVASDCKG